MNIKRIIKKIVPPKTFGMIRDVFYPEKINILEERLNSVFFKQYQNIAAPEASQKIAFRNAEFKVYSKHGGDGILAYIFSNIGATNRTFVEMGIEDGTECNTANLSLNFGWNGLLLDADEGWVEKARNFYNKKLGDFSKKIKINAGFVTVENINQLIKTGGVQGEIDLLSIDIDSNDYWVWKAIDVVQPRVVVMEYNAAFGLHPVTIKYDPRFHYQETFKQNPLYFGASLSALSRLANKKGYVLVACDTHGHDAFFVRKDLLAAGVGKLVELSPEEAFYPNPFTLRAFGSLEKQWEMVKNLPFEEVA